MCEIATTFKMIPQQAIARKKTTANSRFNRDSGAATKNIQKAPERHSNSLGNHKYHSESRNPLCKRKENSCVC